MCLHSCCMSAHQKLLNARLFLLLLLWEKVLDVGYSITSLQLPDHLRLFSHNTQQKTRPKGSVQWSFRRTATVGMLASQAEIGVRVQALGALLQGSGGIAPPEKMEIVREKSGINLVHFWPENGSQLFNK